MALRKLTMVDKRVLTGGAIAIAVGAAGVLLIGTPALADPAPTPRLVNENVTTCADAGLTGSILFGGEGNASGEAGSGTVIDDTDLTVTINAGFTASGIAVKGGPAAFVYDGPFTGPVTITELEAPLVGKPENVPAISHWFVCGGTSTTPTPSGSTPPPTTTAPPTTAPPTTPPATTQPPTTTEPPTTTAPPTTTTAPTTPDDDLPVTGAGVSGLVITGLALIAGGAALLLLRRRRDADLA